MSERVQRLSAEELGLLHSSAMAVLSRTGVVFHLEEALAIFKEHGVRVDGARVHPTEAQIMSALDQVPRSFTMEARNPDRSVTVGGQARAPLAPGYGAPFVARPDGTQTPATMEDYDNFCKLSQTSKVIDLNGFMAVEPQDLRSQTAYLDMLLSTMLLSDKPFLSCPISAQALDDNIRMANILFGGDKAILDRPVMIPTINPLSPLQYSEEMAAAIIGHARWGQPIAITNVVQGGASGPVRLAGLLAVQVAEVLAGMLLGQLVRPGSPFVFGNSCCPMDMRTGGMALGAPETGIIFNLGLQIIQHYGVPSRIGGGLTDSHFPDIRAGMESALLMLTSLGSGTDLIYHSCGILSSYLSMSYEKFLADEELSAMVRRMLEPTPITEETIGLEAIHEVGPGGQHLTRPETFKLCRTEFFIPEFMHRRSYEEWKGQGRLRSDQEATKEVESRLAGYVKPDIDPGVEKDLREFVDQRKGS